MELDRLLAFVGLAVAVVVIPGPDMALIARNVVRDGRRAGFATSLGVVVGTLGWAVAAALGVATILATSAVAFTVLKLAGAAYLVYLGISTLRARDAAVGIGGEAGAGGVDDAPAGSVRVAWVQGLVSALLNPKLGVFFLTMLPQFVTPGEGAAAQAMGLAILFDTIGLVWLLIYSTMLGAARSALGQPGPQRWLRRVTGWLLVGLGTRVALDR